MKIVYLHGFGSKFDPNNKKVKSLSVLGDVVGPNIDYSIPFSSVIGETLSFIPFDTDLIVGTSMGGWLASHVGSLSGIPFVAINPAITPRHSLMKNLDVTHDYYGNEIRMSADVINTYEDFKTSHGCGLILLDDGDSLFDAHITRILLADKYDVVMFEGGSHRFEHMEESLPIIKNFLTNSEMVYGL